MCRYRFLPQPNAVASVVLSKSNWAVLALICHIELFVLAHYHQSIAPDTQALELWKDVFLFHAREESQHAILDELEWSCENAKLTAEERDRAVDDLIDLVAAVDGLAQLQARADADYFVSLCKRPLTAQEIDEVRAGVLYAYRWQYIISGVQDARFGRILGEMINEAQGKRIGEALAPIVNSEVRQARLSPSRRHSQQRSVWFRLLLHSVSHSAATGHDHIRLEAHQLTGPNERCDYEPLIKPAEAS